MVAYEWMFLPILAVVIAGLAFFSGRYSRKESLSLRLEGIRVNRLAKQLLIDLQQHRRMVNSFLSGNSSFKLKIEQKQAAIGQDAAALDALHGKGLLAAKCWEGSAALGKLCARRPLALPAEESFCRHSELIRAVLYSMGDFALVDALWSKLPAVAEGLGRRAG